MTTTNSDALALDGEPREALGASVRMLRRDGITPANLYGRGADSISFQTATRSLEKLVTDGGRGALVELTIAGETYHTLLRGLQRHPVTRAILHADFYRVEMNRPIQTQVPIILTGEAPAARLPDSVVTQMLHEITVECLPSDIPSTLEVDLSGLEELETAIQVDAITVPAGVRIVADPEQMIVRATHSRVADLSAEPSDEAAPEGEEETPEDSEESSD